MTKLVLKTIFIFLLSVQTSLALPLDSPRNYVRTVTYLEHGQDSVVSVQYYDGLGRPVQMVEGGLNSSGLFLHSLISGGKKTGYIYASDGRKLRTTHRQGTRPLMTTDYAGPFEFRDGVISRVNFSGGYFDYDPADAQWSCHYYVTDYQSSHRMVVNREAAPGDSPEQVTHYYPYGGVIGDISTNETLQRNKFEGKELDRTFGLDNYDIHTRNYFAMLPTWDRPDSKAEDYYGISPYVYCGGNPVNLGDYDGRFSKKIGADIAYRIHDAFRPSGERVSGIHEKTNASNPNNRYYYDTYSYNKKDGIVITEVYSMSKDVVDDVGLAGTGIEVAGVGIMCTAVAAPVGAIVAEAGATISTVASVAAIAIDAINGDLNGGLVDALLFVGSNAVKKGIQKLATKNITSEGIEELGESILERGYEASQSSMQSAVSYAEKQKKKE